MLLEEHEQFRQYRRYSRNTMVDMFLDEYVSYAIKLDLTMFNKLRVENCSSYMGHSTEYLIVLKEGAGAAYQEIFNTASKKEHRQDPITKLLNDFASRCAGLYNDKTWRKDTKNTLRFTLAMVEEANKSPTHTTWMLSGFSGYSKMQYRNFARANGFAKYQLKEKDEVSMNNFDKTMSIRFNSDYLSMASLTGEVIGNTKLRELLEQ